MASKSKKPLILLEPESKYRKILSQRLKSKPVEYTITRDQAKELTTFFGRKKSP